MFSVWTWRKVNLLWKLISWEKFRMEWHYSKEISQLVHFRVLCFKHKQISLKSLTQSIPNPIQKPCLYVPNEMHLTEPALCGTSPGKQLNKPPTQSRQLVHSSSYLSMRDPKRFRHSRKDTRESYQFQTKSQFPSDSVDGSAMFADSQDCKYPTFP